MSRSGPAAAEIFSKAIAEHLTVIRQLDFQMPLLASIAQAISGALRRGGKVLWCGNGGSAADSQHLAAELVGRFRRERRGGAPLALTTDTSILTALANDYGYESVVTRQVEALGAPGDVVVEISTSGNSQNVIRALMAARNLGLVIVAFTGAGGGKISAFADHLFAVESRDTARIQEVKILAGHMLCDWIELDLLQGRAD